eukprot:scaffold1414_cov384-Prasinococcus_capsulatus_cf.AAC.20
MGYHHRSHVAGVDRIVCYCHFKLYCKCLIGRLQPRCAQRFSSLANNLKSMPRAHEIPSPLKLQAPCTGACSATLMRA